MRGRSQGIAMLLASCLTLTGCMGLDEATSGMLASTTTPDRVIMKIINNTCGDGEDEEDEEDLSTGQVKGLTKVKDGFAIPYDEYAAEYVCPPEAPTDDSYEANKNRGIGYAGLEAHYPQELAPGQEHSPDWPDGGFEPGGNYPGLTTQEEKYGCCMRWEYAGWNGSGAVMSSSIDAGAYNNFLMGNGSGHYQYLAIHSLTTDKWVICCPYDYGPGTNLPTTGSAHAGRIGGVSPQAAEDLGFPGEGGCPDAAYTEWWWVENSSEVECGPVDDLSAFTGGKGSKSSDTKDDKNSGKTQATVHVASDIVGDISRNGSGVQIAPANENSFTDDPHPDDVIGTIDKGAIQKIVIHELPGTSSGHEECYKAHFHIDEEGRITKRASIGQLTRHTNDDSIDGVSVAIGLARSSLGEKPPNAQMNALDRLIAYIDQQTGTKAAISMHSGEIATETAVPIQKYQESRNHSGVVSVEQVSQAEANHECDDEEEDEENPYAGGPGIAREAVDISGSASPEQPIHGKWDEKPSDSRLSKYVSEKDRVYAGVPGWADCGRCAATAVKGSGADDTFPADRDTAYQYEYMKKSPKWQQAGVMRPGDAPDAMCKPGDVLVTQGKGHIMIYVGNEAVKEKYPTSPANFFEGSLGDYYGWCYLRQVSAESKDYAIFRCIKPDNAGKKGGMSGDRATIIEFARSQIGVPYNNSFAWDNDIPNQQLTCNGLTRWAYDAAGIEIPVSSYEQIEQMPNISSTGSVADLIPGDIVVFDDCNRRPDIGSYPNPGYRHVAIYAGDGEIIEAKVPDTPAGTRALNDGDFSFGGWFGDLGKTLTQKKDTQSKKGNKSDSQQKSDGKTSGTSDSGGTSDASTSNIKGSALGKQLAWLCVQCAATEGNYDSRIQEPSIFPWNKMDDPRLKNLFSVMDAVMPDGDGDCNRAYASCAQAVCGMVAAVVDPDVATKQNGSESPAALSDYLGAHPEAFEQVEIHSLDDLRPGDILDSLPPGSELHAAGHVMIYVGNDMARRKFKNTDAIMFEAGFAEGEHAYYPGLTTYDWGTYQAYGYYCWRPKAKAKNPQRPWVDWEKLVDADTKPPMSDEEAESGVESIDVDNVRVHVNVTKA